MNATQLAAQEVAVLQRLDYAECADDPITFIERHVSIETLSGRPFRFHLWPFQRKTVATIHEHHKLIVLKARQLGLSWIALAYALWVAIFQQGTRILVLCKNEDDAAELLDRVRRMRDRLALDPASAHLLSRLRPSGRVRDAVKTLDIGASTVRALPAKERAARLESAAVVILDEFAFAQESAGIWRAILPTTEAEFAGELEFVDPSGESVLQGDGRLIVVSTGNGSAQGVGPGQEFARQWGRAESGESGFAYLFWPWDARPDRDAEWKRRTLDELGDEERFCVEYPEQPAHAFLVPDTETILDPSAISASIRLGAQHDKLRARDEMPPPVGGSLVASADWGVHSHVLLLWPLEAGGFYVVREFAYEGTDVESIAPEVAEHVRKIGYPVHEERFDASMPGLNTVFMKALRRQLALRIPHLAVPFNKFKTVSIDYLRLLTKATRAGKVAPVLSISPLGCPRLCEQLRGWHYKDPETGLIEKKDDHGPDALVAGVAPEAAKRHPKMKEKRIG